MKKDFHVANIDRFRSGGANNTSVKENKADVAENAPPRPGEVLPEQKPSLKAESVIRQKEDKKVAVAKKRSAQERPRVDIRQGQPSHSDIAIMTDRHTYDELCIKLKEQGKSIRSGLRDMITDIIENQKKEDIERTIKSAGIINERPYKTSVRIPYSLYLKVYRYSRRNHVSLLQIVNAAIAEIMTK